MESADYVLSKFNEEETKVMAEAVKKAGEAVLDTLENGVERAMNEVNVE